MWILRRDFTKQRGLKIHMARWCHGGRSQRSRRGSLTDTAVKTAKRRAAEATLDNVSLGDDVLENVLSFEYLGSRRQCDGDDRVDVRHRMNIAQAAFGSLSHLWTDHRLSPETKLRLYKLSVCSSLTHCCISWALTRTMIRSFNSRCLHVITGEDNRATATTPVYDLVLAMRKRRIRLLGHVFRLPPDRIMRRSLIALVKGGTFYPEQWRSQGGQGGHGPPQTFGKCFFPDWIDVVTWLECVSRPGKCAWISVSVHKRRVIRRWPENVKLFPGIEGMWSIC